MLKLTRIKSNKLFLNGLVKINVTNNLRTFLSQAYHCNEVWDHRLNSPLLQKVNLDELYYEIDQRFQKTKQISAVDVDIFANTINNEVFTDELLDVVHKLRLSAESCNMLESTSHAVIRALKQFGKHEDLLTALDDRLNYGIFLDQYSANILLDLYWKEKDFLSGCRVASQLMLQEELDNDLSNNLSLLHCFNYLLKPTEWPQPEKPQEPDEEVKIRVKYLRNEYNDNHFDLREANKIIGKTLKEITKHKNDALSKSFHILGLSLYEQNEEAKKELKECTEKNITFCKEILDLIPQENEVKKGMEGAKTENMDVNDLLQKEVEKIVHQTSEKDIATLCQMYSSWEEKRTKAINEQVSRINTANRLENIEDLKKIMKEKETKLWFFENEEQIELDIEAKKIYHPKRWFGKKKKPRKVDEGYVPPDVGAKLGSQ